MVRATHSLLSCMRNDAGTSVSADPEQRVTCAYHPLSLHLVPARSVVFASSASRTAYTSSIRTTSTIPTCFQRSPWGSVVTSTCCPSLTAPSIMLRIGDCAMVSVCLCVVEGAMDCGHPSLVVQP